MRDITLKGRSTTASEKSRSVKVVGMLIFFGKNLAVGELAAKSLRTKEHKVKNM